MSLELEQQGTEVPVASKSGMRDVCVFSKKIS